jgi:hypothetical protein
MYGDERTAPADLVSRSAGARRPREFEVRLSIASGFRFGIGLFLAGFLISLAVSAVWFVVLGSFIHALLNAP